MCVYRRAYYGAVPANTSVFNTLSDRRGTRVLYDRHILTHIELKKKKNNVPVTIIERIYGTFNDETRGGMVKQHFV